MSGSDIAAMVGSRFCHDLVSPLGAIGNGVELLKMTSDASAELELIDQAVSQALARVRLYRLAFGPTAPGQDMAGNEVGAILSGLTLKGRLKVRCALPATLSARRAKRLALAALCAESALGLGGTVEIDGECVTATGQRLTLDQDLWHPLLQGHAPETPSASSIHFSLLAASGPVMVGEGQTETGQRRIGLTV